MTATRASRNGDLRISAGADKVRDEFARAVKEAGLKHVDVIPTGCVGRCDLEPMAEVTRGDEPPVLYIRLTPEKVAQDRRRAPGRRQRGRGVCGIVDSQQVSSSLELSRLRLF